MPIPVLIIERNDVVREAVCHMVKVAGFRGIALADTDSALRVLANIEFKIMITGIAANDLAVAPFVSAAKAVQPDLRIIVSKKYAGETTYPLVIGEYVNFPFSMSELQSALKKVLEQDETPRT
jgi:DNA-binding NtrC family response regulator